MKTYDHEPKETEKFKRCFAVMDQILEHVKQNPGLSFYMLKAYAYRNDLHTWIEAVEYRPTRQTIALYIRDFRKFGKFKYGKPFHEAYSEMIDEAIAYEKRKKRSD